MMSDSESQSAAASSPRPRRPRAANPRGRTRRAPRSEPASSQSNPSAEPPEKSAAAEPLSVSAPDVGSAETIARAHPNVTDPIVDPTAETPEPETFGGDDHEPIFA